VGKSGALEPPSLQHEPLYSILLGGRTTSLRELPIGRQTAQVPVTYHNTCNGPTSAGAVLRRRVGRRFSSGLESPPQHVKVRICRLDA
jgi:hypothetical protein